MERVLEFLATHAPTSLQVLVPIVVVALIAWLFIGIWRSWQAPEGSVLWGAAKWRRDAEVEKLLNDFRRGEETQDAVLSVTRLAATELAEAIASMRSNNLVGASKRLDHALGLIAVSAQQSIRAPGYLRSAILIPQQPTGGLPLMVGWSPSYTSDANTNLRFDENSRAGHCYQRREIDYCRDVQKDPRFVRNPLATHQFSSLICVPIQTGSRVRGVLQIDSTVADAFGKDEDHLTILAKLAATLLEARDMIALDGEVTNLERGGEEDRRGAAGVP